MQNENSRFNLILINEKFIEYCRKNNESEVGRKFCLHNIQHSIDVARIAYIINIEKNLGYTQDIIYAVALLHDIGRWQQYTDNIPHHISSSLLAVDILKECGYVQDEIELIKNAITDHRNDMVEDSTLSFLLYYSDKKSRNCFACEAVNECNWSEQKKNHFLIY